jgi:hypothetical protein
LLSAMGLITRSATVICRSLERFVLLKSENHYE